MLQKEQRKSIYVLDPRIAEGLLNEIPPQKGDSEELWHRG